MVEIIPFRFSYRPVRLASALGIDVEPLQQALRTGQLLGKVAGEGSVRLVLGRHLQDWLNRGAPRCDGDPEPLTLTGYAVGSPEPNRLAFSLDQTAHLVSLSTSFLVGEIGRKKLLAKRAGIRYVIPAAAIEDWLDRLEDAKGFYSARYSLYTPSYATWEPPRPRRRYWYGQ